MGSRLLASIVSSSSCRSRCISSGGCPTQIPTRVTFARQPLLLSPTTARTTSTTTTTPPPTTTTTTTTAAVVVPAAGKVATINNTIHGPSKYSMMAWPWLPLTTRTISTMTNSSFASSMAKTTRNPFGQHPLLSCSSLSFGLPSSFSCLGSKRHWFSFLSSSSSSSPVGSCTFVPIATTVPSRRLVGARGAATPPALARRYKCTIRVNKSVMARFRKRADGSLKRWKQNNRHNKGKKDRQWSNRLSKSTTFASKNEERRLLKMMGK